MRRWRWPALLVWAGLLAACASSTPVPATYDFGAHPESAAQFEAWFDGAQPAAAIDGAEASELFLAGEARYWAGDLEGAYDYYVAMLVDHAGHALNRYAAMRLYRMRQSVVGFADRMAADLGGKRFDEESPLTRLELARIAFEVAHSQWERDQEAVPFRFYGAGFSHRWRATPPLSPWRLTDFDRSLAPESQPRLADHYRSPYFAHAASAHNEPTQVVAVDELRQPLNLGDSGIYYLESLLEVDGPGDRDLILAAQFPGAARVWVGDEQVLDYDESDYQSGRLMRAVTLSPGTHRVSVKLAYRAGTRDWMDMLWVPTEGDIFGDAGMRATLEAEGQASEASAQVGARQFQASHFEPVRIGAAKADEQHSSVLYAAALSAYASGEYRRFERAWRVLMERHPSFVGGYLLGSYQVRTRWDMPSELRDTQALSRLRQAQQSGPDNLHVLVQLERLLGDNGGDREVRRLLERARELAYIDGDGGATGRSDSVGQAGQASVDEPSGGARSDGEALRVRQIRPLIAWAQYLRQQGFDEQAERAWRQVLAVDDRQCSAMAALQSLYRQRSYYPRPEEISSHWHSCPHVVKNWLADHPARQEAAVEFAKTQGLRQPYSAQAQQNWAQALVAVGDVEEAAQVLDEALARLPKSAQLWDARIELALADDEQAAVALLDEAMAAVGRMGTWQWQRARLTGQLPLQAFLRDGLAAAREEIELTGRGDGVDAQQEAIEGDDERAMALDDAYYVIDFVAREYFDDGSSWVLTHQLVRAMTRGAIDQYAELTVPRNAYLLQARTIKEDGQVRIPEGVSGDSTISMPGLSPGDMVELAYLQFRPPPAVALHTTGNPFYFRMANVSSRLSEYVVIGTEDFEFEGENNPPEAEIFEFEGRQAHRFKVTDSRQPRQEPRRVAIQEFLPWVREVRLGIEGDVLDVERRYLRETFVGSARRSASVDEAIATWLGRPFPDDQVRDEDVKNLFYGAADWFRSINAGRFSVDASHAVQRRTSSPLVPLSLAFDELGVDYAVYLARSDEAPPNERQTGEIGNFRHTLMQVTMPESQRSVWLQLDRRDAMFGAVAPELVGQPAICLTCEELERREVTVADGRQARRHIDLEARLAEDGTLRGALHYELTGRRAVRVRAALRNRRDNQDRQSYFAEILTGQIPGASLVDFDVDGEARPDDPLRLTVDFERPQFARSEGDQLVIDSALFEERLQHIYASLAARESALFITYDRKQSYRATIELPDHMDVALAAVDVEEEEGQSAFGTFYRRTAITDGQLRLESAIELSRQRVPAADYQAFRQWATTVQDSGDLWLELSL